MKSGPVNFTVLGETPDLLAVDKPAGLLVHPTKPGGPLTLWDGLRELLAYEIVNGGQVSLINRLDRETSGVVLVCKSAAAARACGRSMERGQVRKEYLAVVQGWPGEETFAVDAPIRRLGEVEPVRIWLKRGVHEGGQEARTNFRVEARVEGSMRLSLVRCWPLTGRTHQIRVHLAHAGFPVIGDKLYGPDEGNYLEFIETGWTPELAGRLHLPRHALHSQMLEVEFQGQWHRWEAPLPEDMAGLIRAAVPDARP